ncbi:MAG: uracil-DNA glycosylase, partial [Pseudonocardiales bacterium]|nr:uracil-DNA glycosylase [Pseudonocardiales bacterium]
GKPFVGPAGKLLLRALTDLGVERRTVYLSNTVKHSGGRRPTAAIAGSTRHRPRGMSAPADRGFWSRLPYFVRR